MNFIHVNCVQRNGVLVKRRLIPGLLSQNYVGATVQNILLVCINFTQGYNNRSFNSVIQSVVVNNLCCHSKYEYSLSTHPIILAPAIRGVKHLRALLTQLQISHCHGYTPQLLILYLYFTQHYKKTSQELRMLSLSLFIQGSL